MFMFQGNELCVRATKQIQAGSEIYITCPNYYDYEERTTLLKKLWNKSCDCQLCLQGPLGPSGALRQRVFDTVIYKKAPYKASEIELLIKDMHVAGFNHSADLMRYAYAAALTAYVQNMQTADALKTSLILYYLIEPRTVPKTSDEFRISTLCNLIELSRPCEENIGLSALPLQLREVLLALHMHWVYSQLVLSERYFGVEDRVIQVERVTFRARLHRLMQDFEIERDYIFISMDSEEDRQRLVILLNAVLRWAGIPPLTEGELLDF